MCQFCDHGFPTKLKPTTSKDGILACMRNFSNKAGMYAQMLAVLIFAALKFVGDEQNTRSRNFFLGQLVAYKKQIVGKWALSFAA